MRSFIVFLGLVATAFAAPVPQGSLTAPLKEIPAVNGLVTGLGQLAEPVTGTILPGVLDTVGSVPLVGSTVENAAKGVVAEASNLKREDLLSGLGGEVQPAAQLLEPVLNVVDGVTSEVGVVGPVSNVFGRQATDPVGGVLNVVEGLLDGNADLDLPLVGSL